MTVHIQGQMPARANQARENKNGQENLEEVEEDRSDQAVDGDEVERTQGVGLFLRIRSAPKCAARPGKKFRIPQRAAARTVASLFCLPLLNLDVRVLKFSTSDD
jgi:hypothetical protein